jgi:hypothetical protein
MTSEYFTLKAVPLTRHEDWVERRYSSCSFLTSALNGGEWSASRPGRVYPRKMTPCTHCIGGWVGLRAGLDTEARGKNPLPLPASNPSRPVCSQTVH